MEEWEKAKKQRLKEERKIMPLDRPLYKAQIRCPQCQGKPQTIKDNLQMTVFDKDKDEEKRIKVYRCPVYECKDCRIQFICDIHIFALCDLYKRPDSDKYIMVGPDDCAVCPHFPGPGEIKNCEHFVTFIKDINTIDQEWQRA